MIIALGAFGARRSSGELALQMDSGKEGIRSSCSQDDGYHPQSKGNQDQSQFRIPFHWLPSVFIDTKRDSRIVII